MSGPTILPKIKEIQNVVQKLSREQESAAGSGGDAQTGTKHEVTPGIPGWLEKVWQMNRRTDILREKNTNVLWWE